MAPWLPRNIWSQFCSPKLESMQPSCMRGENLSSEVHSLDLVLAFLTIHRSWISCPWVIVPMCCTSFWQSSIKITSSCLKHKPQAKIVPACCMDILFSCSTAPGKRHATSAGCPVQRVLWRDSDSDRISYNTSATFNQIPFWRKTHVPGVFPNSTSLPSGNLDPNICFLNSLNHMKSNQQASLVSQ